VTCALPPSRCSAIPAVSRNFGNGLSSGVNIGILSGYTSRHRAPARAKVTALGIVGFSASWNTVSQAASLLREG
jgi:hypothetical protein